IGISKWHRCSSFSKNPVSNFRCWHKGDIHLLYFDIQFHKHSGRYYHREYASHYCCRPVV
ncbi:hypothetical protein, partial [Citrobacter portucalensis]